MWILILLFFLLIFYLLEAVVALPLVLVLVVALSTFEDIRTTALIAFLAGILTDVRRVGPLGISSLFFLALSLLVILYQRKFRGENLVFLLLATFITTQIYNFLYTGSRSIAVIPGLVSSFLAVLLVFVLYQLKPKS